MEDLVKIVKSVKGKMNGYAAHDSLPDFRFSASKTVKPLCGLTAFSIQWRTRYGQGTALPTYQEQAMILASHSKIPPSFAYTKTSIIRLA